ncbi:SLBB domain-containing protein [Metabacillus sp. RGM 3146]|uniref:SLBB domain-containing protein n=1 Tax=Metabacillus sp. RGM 3146 TaxID=3401092 RepID=UPI003B9DA0B0
MEFIQKNKWLLWTAIGAVIAVLLFQMTKTDDTKKQVPPNQEETESAISFNGEGKKEQTSFPKPAVNGTDAEAASKDSGVLVVDVKGAVRSPGVYEMKKGSRVNDAVAIAGGLTEKADKKAVNLASVLQDGTVVYDMSLFRVKIFLLLKQLLLAAAICLLKVQIIR